MRKHRYVTQLTWTGAPRGRDYVLSTPGKPDLAGSCDAAFGGDRTRWNPEDLLVASLSACHQLWYLSLCSAAGIAVLAYEDEAEGTMIEPQPGGAGKFTEVILRPRVTLASGADQARAEALHQDAHDRCFIACSVNFPVHHRPVIQVAASAA